MKIEIESDEMGKRPTGYLILRSYLEQKQKEMLNKANYAEPKNKVWEAILEDPQCFPVSIDDVKKDIKMTYPRQNKFFRMLVRDGVVKIKRRELPGKRWIRLMKKG